MTSSTLAPTATSRQRAEMHPARQQKGRVATVIVMLGALLLAGVMRQVCAIQNAHLVNIRGTAAARSTLGNMDSFALALLLGGLRGPLIMFLWPAIENQKADHDLKSVDTMIEWVRLLQPEFDSVHLFQIWNKAYNISAMMASPANKYTVIMEAIDYAGKVDQEKPGDLNILGAMANVYGGKFGSTNLPEFAFYGKQFREDSMTEANRAAAYPEEKKYYQRLYKWESLSDEKSDLVSLLDAHNDIRPDRLVETQPRPAGLDPASEWNDGSALQYLKKYQPFPYGVSPLAMAFNYAKRAEVAQSVEGQKPLQLSSMVVDSQPPLQLKFWEEDAARHGRFYEARAFNISAIGGTTKTEAALAAVKINDPIANRPAIDAALYYYETARRLSGDALVEYDRHLAKPEYKMRAPTYRPHKADMNAALAMDKADHDYLAALVETNPAKRKELLINARDKYTSAMHQRERTALLFYTEDEALWAPGVMPPAKTADARHPHDKEHVMTLSDYVLSKVYDNAMIVATKLNLQEHADDRLNYGISVDRCRMRVDLINAAL
ncbi:MAG TPA: hypothetical protein VFE47_03600 [Tepidisphaeraceae bacterium]|jgi:hypothetical protein|nr:hypothetical protein [Tepidisphaeraceae bacterium]